MSEVNVVYVPVFVPVNGVNALLDPAPARYPRQDRERQPPWPRQGVRDERTIRRMIADAKKMLAEERASRLLKQLDR
jgi:hypothetical protein